MLTRSALLALATLILASAGCGRATDEVGPPNVLLIVIDDLNMSLGAYGDEIAHTPNIDRIAARGVRFDGAYVQFPLCGPSRTSMLCGYYPEVTRVLRNHTNPRIAVGDAPFLPEHFMKHGYRATRAGKVAHRPGAIRWSPRSRQEELAALAPDLAFAAPIPIAFQPLNVEDAEMPDGKAARFGARVIELERDAPFFLAIGLMKPHLPFSVPPKYYERYPPNRFPMLREDPDHLKDLPPIAAVHDPRDAEMHGQRRRRVLAAYYACIEFVDAQIGLLLDALDREQLWDDTIVVVVSDHGFHLGEHLGLWRKGTLFEQSLRVPLLIAAPGLSPGTVVAEPVEVLDIYPTLAELARLPIPAGLQGRSLAPLMREPGSGRNSVAYSVIRFDEERLGRSIRTKRYRYSAWDGLEGEALYDHQRDPGEYENLANDPRQAKTLGKMRRLMEQKKSQAVAVAPR